MTAATIRPDRILRQLDELWIAHGRQQQEGAAPAVLRACAMTLIVFAGNEPEDPPVAETLAGLMEEHPSRVIIVRVTPGEERRLESRVTAQCWMPFGSGRQICSEQVEIRSSTAALPDLAGVIRALTVPDLPVVIWRRPLWLADSPDLAPILALADKVIVNSSGCAGPGRFLAMMAGLRSPGRAVADLSWTRLTRWRETIAQVFSNPSRLARLSDVERVVVTHYGSTAPVRGRYLAAWLRGVIGEGARYEFVPAHRLPCQPLGEVQGVLLEGPGLRVTLEQLEGESVALCVGDLCRQIVFQMLDERRLLAEELTIEGRDAVFERVLDRAIQEAGG